MLSVFDGIDFADEAGDFIIHTDDGRKEILEIGGGYAAVAFQAKQGGGGVT